MKSSICQFLWCPPSFLLLFIGSSLSHWDLKSYFGWVFISGHSSKLSPFINNLSNWTDGCLNTLRLLGISFQSSADQLLLIVCLQRSPFCKTWLTSADASNSKPKIYVSFIKVALNHTSKLISLNAFCVCKLLTTVLLSLKQFYGFIEFSTSIVRV